MLRFPGKMCSEQVQVGSQKAGESPTVGITVWKSFEETESDMKKPFSVERTALEAGHIASYTCGHPCSEWML